MRIGFDGKFLASNATFGSRSGNSVHAKELLRHLTTLDTENEYRIYLLDPIPHVPGKDNVKAHVLSSLSKISYLRYGIEYPFVVHRDPIDVLISFTTLPPLARCKHLLFLADISWIAHPEWFPLRVSLPHAVDTRIAVRRADMIAAPTEFSKLEIIHRLKVPEHKVAVVPHGIREQFLERVDHGQVEGVKKKYGMPGGYILSINDIHERKNLDGLIDAFCYLKETYGIQEKLVLVGQTLWSYKTFFTKLESAKYRDDIILTGYVPGEDIRPLYQGASLFVYPSFYEGWGLQVHEAMASGIPVAVSHQSSLSEISGDAALQFNPHDSRDMAEVMFKILSDSPLAHALIAKGYDQIKRFSWEQSARMTLNLCHRLQS
jgi:glycosyltransferase involved in cell wall biosynthesis